VNTENEIALSYQDMNALTLEARWQLSTRYSLVSVTGWRSYKETIATDVDPIAFDFYYVVKPQTYSQASEEVRLEGQPFEELNTVGGLYLWYSRYATRQNAFYGLDQGLFRTMLIGTLPKTFPDYGGQPPLGTSQTLQAGQSTKSIAPFGEVDWEFIKRMRLTAGARYTYDQKDFHIENGFTLPGTDGLLGTGPYRPDPVGRLTGNHGWGAFTGRTGLDYQPPPSVMGANNGAMVYGTYGRGFKSGGYNGRANSELGAQPYKPEYVDQIEVGLKTAWAKNRLTVNVAGFYSFYSDKQEAIVLLTSQGGPNTIFDNAAQARIKGIEWEVSAAPLHGNIDIIDGTRLSVSGSVLDAKYSTFKADLVGTGVPVDNSGARLLDAPVFQTAVGLAIPFDLRMDTGDRLTLDAMYRYRTSMSLTNTPDAKGYLTDYSVVGPASRLDGSLTYERDDLLRGAWRFTVFVKNITDEATLASKAALGPVFAVGMFLPPREFGAEVQARY
jgi:iron complex outermembrane receptor protein